MSSSRLLARCALCLLVAAGLTACAGAQPNGIAAEPTGVTVYGTADVGVGRVK